MNVAIMSLCFYPKKMTSLRCLTRFFEIARLLSIAVYLLHLIVNNMTDIILKVWDREKIVIIPDHYIFTSDERANRNVDILREFCVEQNIKYFYDIKDLSNFKVCICPLIWIQFGNSTLLHGNCLCLVIITKLSLHNVSSG